MKAIVLEELDKPMRVKEVPDPLPAPGEALVRIHAAALNHRDLWIQKGQYAGIRLPVIPGSDGSGIVEKVYDEKDKRWEGKEVILNPSLNWGNDPQVQAKDYVILGTPDNGTFASHVVIPSRLLHEKPVHLTWEEAAALPLAGLTAWRATMVKAAVKKGENVLITGAGGGVALFCIQFAIALGCNVYVTSGNEQKIEKAVALGARAGKNYRLQGWDKELKGMSGGFDALVDSSGGDTFAKLVDLAKPAGRIAMYGATAGIFNSGVPAKIFWKQLHIMGSTMGNDKEFRQMLDFVNLHEIKPVIDKVFPLEEAQQAIDRMKESAQFGKIVLRVQ